jgi:muramoyltetrapeptide carboxypeptidase
VTTPLRALRAGDRLGLCAPSGPVNPDRLATGVTTLEGLGFEVQWREEMLSRSRLSAGSVERRVGEIHDLFRDDAVAGIVCARGGVGAGWLLPLLDTALLRAHPKPFVGYSDATFLHLLLDQIGVPSFHGPMASVDLSDGSYDKASFLGALTGGERYRTSLKPLRSGTAEGTLRGGCLSILASAVGTPFGLRRREDTLLFLEDVGEPPYQLDRMLFQLRASGALEGVRGIVFGEMKGCHPPEDAPFALRHVLLDALEGLEIPVAAGLPSGHTTGANVTLPLGVPARLRCGEEAWFEVLGEAVA